MVTDANVILRFMLRDNEEHFKKASALFRSGGKCLVTDVTIMEVAYVLGGRYGKSRNQIAEALQIFLVQDFVNYQGSLAFKYLTLYAAKKLDLADCYLIYLAIEEDVPLRTFDKRMSEVYTELVK